MSEKFMRAIMLLVSALSLAVVATPALARHELSPTGGVGDAGAKPECPPGQMLVGFSGRVGLWITEIQTICATPQAGGGISQPVAMGPVYGSAYGTQAQTRYCPRNSMLTSILKRMTRGNQIASIGLTCRSRTTGEETSETFGNPGYVYKCGGFGVGNCGASSAEDQLCPGGEVAVGYTVRYGKDVNGLGLICAPVADAPAPVAAAPPPPRPIKVIKQTGRPRADPSAMNGLWKMTTSQNGHFELTLIVVGNSTQVMEVQGFFNNTDGVPAYNGSLTGTIAPGQRTMVYTYAQPASKTDGHGELTLSNDGNSINGSGVDGPSGTKFTWGGPRK